MTANLKRQTFVAREARTHNSKWLLHTNFIKTPVNYFLWYLLWIIPVVEKYSMYYGEVYSA